MTPTQVRPRDVFCVIERVYRRRSVADEVVAGRFVLHGVACDLGTEPDWLTAALPPDPEWRLEWTKFYYGLDLAAAFRDTRDARYQHAWERLVRSWIRQVPAGADPSDVIGRRIQNWIYAWNAFAAGRAFAGLGDTLDEAIVHSIEAQADHLRQHLTRERNHRTLELYALFIVSLALPELDPDGSRLSFATGALVRNLLDDVCEDGVQRERSTHYHHVVLRSFLGMRENARRFGLALPEAFDDRLASACEFSLHCHRPDGGIPALSDSDGGSYRDLLALAGDLLARPDFTYAATAGATGTPPAVRHVSFPVGGYFVQRSGWGDRGRAFDAERYLIFDCGPLGDGGHGHYDALNVEIAAGGRPLVVDPGRFTYSDEPPHWRRWFKSTRAHNTVSVDGLDQTPYRRGKPKGPVAEARLLARLAGSGLDVLWGEVRGPAYDARHRRRVIFVDDDYWIVHDHVEASVPHRYEQRFHLAADAQHAIEEIEQDGCRGILTASAALLVARPWPIVIEQGWVSPLYGFKEEAPVVVAVASDILHADFVAAIVPLDGGRAVPAFRVDHRRVDGEDLFIAEVVHAGASERRDRVAWSRSGSFVDLFGSGTYSPVAWTSTPREAAGATA